jgi:hypothetical protein
MKSNKQRRKEIKERRIARALELTRPNVDIRWVTYPVSGSKVAADPAQLVHNNTYGFLPEFYVDRVFVCRDCGSQELWTAKQQKWWYEIAKGHIDSVAVRCKPCRRIEQARRDEARRVHLEGIAAKQAAKEKNKTP